MNGKSLLKALLVLLKPIVLCSAIPANNLVLIDKIVAKINDRIILLSEVEALHMQAFSWSGGGHGEYLSKQEILNRLVESRLVISQAKEEGVVLNADRVNQELNHRIGYLLERFGSIAALEGYFGKAVREIKIDLRKQIGEQILVQDITNKVIANVQVTPTQVAEFYKRTASEMPMANSLKYEMLELSKDVAISKSVLETIIKKVVRLKDLATSKGLTLQELTAEGSVVDDVSTTNVKNIAWEVGSTVAPVYESRVISLPIGAISDVIVEKNGMYLVQVLDKNLPRVRVIELFFPFYCDKYITQAKSEMEEMKNRYLSCTYDCNPEKFFSREKCKNGSVLTKRSIWYEEESLPSEVSSAFETQDIISGAVSKVVFSENNEGNVQVKLFCIVKIVSPHKLNLEEDYDKITALCLESKREAILSSWVKKIKKNSLVWVDSV